MTPPPARLLAVAPGFHSRVTWADRLLLGAGRVPTEEELAMLVLDDPRADLRDCLCLFQIPAHMRSAFWTMLERAGELPPDDAERYFTSVARFFEYKHFAAPPGAVFEVVASQQGQAAVIRPNASWGAINLGNETTALVF